MGFEDYKRFVRSQAVYYGRSMKMETRVEHLDGYPRSTACLILQLCCGHSSCPFLLRTAQRRASNGGYYQQVLDSRSHKCSADEHSRAGAGTVVDAWKTISEADKKRLEAGYLVGGTSPGRRREAMASAVFPQSANGIFLPRHRTEEQTFRLLRTCGLNFSSEPVLLSSPSLQGGHLVYPMDMESYKRFVCAQCLYYGRAMYFDDDNSNRSHWQSVSCTAGSYSSVPYIGSGEEQGELLLRCKDPECSFYLRTKQCTTTENSSYQQVLCGCEHTCSATSHLKYDLVDDIEFLVQFLRDDFGEDDRLDVHAISEKGLLPKGLTTEGLRQRLKQKYQLELQLETLERAVSVFARQEYVAPKQTSSVSPSSPSSNCTKLRKMKNMKAILTPEARNEKRPCTDQPQKRWKERRKKRKLMAAISRDLELTSCSSLSQSIGSSNNGDNLFLQRQSAGVARLRCGDRETQNGRAAQPFVRIRKLRILVEGAVYESFRDDSLDNGNRSWDGFQEFLYPDHAPPDYSTFIGYHIPSLERLIESDRPRLESMRLRFGKDLDAASVEAAIQSKIRALEPHTLLPVQKKGHGNDDDYDEAVAYRKAMATHKQQEMRQRLDREEDDAEEYRIRQLEESTYYGRRRLAEKKRLATLERKAVAEMVTAPILFERHEKLAAEKPFSCEHGKDCKLCGVLQPALEPKGIGRKMETSDLFTPRVRMIGPLHFCRGTDMRRQRDESVQFLCQMARAVEFIQKDKEREAKKREAYRV